MSVVNYPILAECIRAAAMHSTIDTPPDAVIFDAFTLHDLTMKEARDREKRQMNS